MPVPNTFANATTSIPLSQLDQNFATAITLGNTAIQLGNTVTTLNNMTFANVTINSVASTFPNSYLANNAVTIGNTSVSLGGTQTSFGNMTLTNVTISSVSAAIGVAQGGTGATTLTGVLKGNGTSAFTAATAGTDFVAPGGALGTPSSGNLSNCTADGTNSVGYRNIPQSGSDKTTSYTLATGDIGEFVGVGTGGSITIPNSTFAAGDVVSIFNNTSGNITITCSITTAYVAGTNTDRDTLTLATRGVATILFISGTVCVVTGNVS